MVTFKSFATSVAFIVSVSAQNLTYGAQNFYRSDNVTGWPVRFSTLFDTAIAGQLFAANNLQAGDDVAALIIGHPMGAVKEQSSNLYAAKMAERGFLTMSLDLPFWGDSEGSPRQAVLPDMYAEAFSAAADYMTSEPNPMGVNISHIGVIGICGSGSFALNAAKIDPRFEAIATVSMYDMGAVTRNGLRRAQSLEQRQEVIQSAIIQRSAERNGAPIRYTGGTPYALTNDTDDVGREFYDFYRTSRGLYTPPSAAPNMTTQPTLSSNTKFMNFYPLSDIDSISPRPILIVAGTNAHSREFSEDAFDQARDPKELLWIEGAGHADLYDRTELIPFDRLEAFFNQWLDR